MPVPFSVLVIATHNRKKAGEMIQILSASFPEVEFKTLADYAEAPEPEETGSTYAENAVIKAESASAVTGEWSLADDAGLEIDALDGAPGVHSKRFEGESTSFPDKMARILELLKDVPDEGRGARFRCCVALTQPLGLLSEPVDLTPRPVGVENPDSTVLFEAVCEGRIAREPRGSGGFGYDPIFFIPELGCSMAELTSEQKHAVSHRGKVLRMLEEYLRGEG
jgi:XTP/dITP diphosphohydrolase